MLNPEDCRQNLWTSFHLFYRTGQYADLELVFPAGNPKILCHKLILASVSATFRQILRNADADAADHGDVTSIFIPGEPYEEVKQLLDSLYWFLEYGSTGTTDISISGSMQSLFQLEQKLTEWVPLVPREPKGIPKALPVSKPPPEVKEEPQFDEDDDYLVPEFLDEDEDGDFDDEDKDLIMTPLSSGKSKKRKKTTKAQKALKLKIRKKDSYSDEENMKEFQMEDDPANFSRCKSTLKLKDANCKEELPDGTLINTEIEFYNKPGEYLVEVKDIKERRILCQMMEQSGTILNVEFSPQRMELKKHAQFLSRYRQPYFLALLGVVHGDFEVEKHLRAKPLCWSFPNSSEIPAQFDNVFHSFQHVFGFSNSDICYRPDMYSRQGMYRLNRSGKVKFELKRKYATLDDKQLHDMMEQTDIVSALRRYPSKPSFKLTKGPGQISLDKDIPFSELDGVLFLSWSPESREITARPVVIQDETDRDKLSAEFMTVVFEVWCLERRIWSKKYLPRCDYLCKKYDDLIVPMETIKVIEEFKSDVGGKQRQDILKKERQCPECGCQFSTVTVSQECRYNGHVKKHYYEKFECDCDYVFSDLNEKIAHIKLVHGNNYSKCDYCNYVGNRSCLERHACEGKIAAGVPVTRREEISLAKRAVVPKELCVKPLHPKREKGPSKANPGGFICCEQHFDSHSSITKHVETFHAANHFVKCDQCKFVSNINGVSLHRGRAHSQTVHGEPKQEFICELCGKQQKSKNSLQSHMNSYHKNRTCETCGECFQTHHSYVFHQRKEHKIGIKPYLPCETCGKEFATITRLKNHILRIHTDDKDRPFRCEVCGRGFDIKHSLEVHQMQAHIKARPFKCRYGCGADYNDHSSRGTHELKKHGARFPKQHKPHV